MEKGLVLERMLDKMVSHSVHQSPERHPGLMGLILCILVNQHTVRYSAAKERKFSDDFFSHVANKNLTSTKSDFLC